MFNEKPIKKESSASKISKPRERRSDKKHDIKIPISAYNKKLVLFFARRKGLSVTHYCTNLVSEALWHHYDFEDVKYKHSVVTVHIKADRELYLMVVDKSVEWCCSLRKAGHRILNDALRMEVENNEIIQQKKPTAKIY